MDEENFEVIKNDLEKIFTAIRQSPDVDDQIIEFMATDNPKYLYGNGLQTAVCLGIFRDMGISVDGVMLPPGIEKQHLRGYWGELLEKTPDIGMLDIDRINRKKISVLLSIPRKSYCASREMLESQGYQSIYECCWKRNDDLKHICYKLYTEKSRCKK